MTHKAMIFIDGTWLYLNQGQFAQAYGQAEYRVDYGKLGHVLREEASRRLGGRDVDVVRQFYFGSYPVNVDPQDADRAIRRQDFFRVLREQHYYEVETHPIDFRGQRLSRRDRGGNESEIKFPVKEKCVDIALATKLVSLAARHAYDTAICVLGDRDFMPALKEVRQWGKQVIIASVRGSCSAQFSDQWDREGVRDVDIVWLEERLGDLEYRPNPQLLYCSSRLHTGENPTWQEFGARDDRPYFCQQCRAAYKQLCQRAA